MFVRLRTPRAPRRFVKVILKRRTRLSVCATEVSKLPVRLMDEDNTCAKRVKLLTTLIEYSKRSMDRVRSRKPRSIASAYSDYFFFFFGAGEQRQRVEESFPASCDGADTNRYIIRLKLVILKTTILNFIL